MQQLMSPKRLQFITKADANGDKLSLVIDIENQLFSWCNHWANLSFYKLSRKEIKELRDQLIWFGFKEVN